MHDPEPPVIVTTMVVGPYRLIQYSNGIIWIHGDDGDMVKVPYGEFVKKLDEIYGGRYT